MACDLSDQSRARAVRRVDRPSASARESRSAGRVPSGLARRGAGICGPRSARLRTDRGRLARMAQCGGARFDHRRIIGAGGVRARRATQSRADDATRAVSFQHLQWGQSPDLASLRRIGRRLLLCALPAHPGAWLLGHRDGRDVLAVRPDPRRALALVGSVWPIARAHALRSSSGQALWRLDSCCWRWQRANSSTGRCWRQ